MGESSEIRTLAHYFAILINFFLTLFSAFDRPQVLNGTEYSGFLQRFQSYFKIEMLLTIAATATIVTAIIVIVSIKTISFL